MKKKGLSLFVRMLIAIIGVSIMITAITAYTLHSYTVGNIEDRLGRQLEETLDTTVSYFDKVYAVPIQSDLMLFESSSSLNNLMMASDGEHLIVRSEVERFLLGLSRYRKTYKSIRFIDRAGNEKVAVSGRKRLRTYSSVQQLSSGDLLQQMTATLYERLKAAGTASILFEGPVRRFDGSHSFMVGMKKEDPEIGGFGGAVIIHADLSDFIGYLRNIDLFGEPFMLAVDSKNRVLISLPEGRMMPESELIVTEETVTDTDAPFYVGKCRLGSEHHDFISIILGMPFEMLRAETRGALHKTAGMAVVLLIYSSIVAFFLARRISEPVKELASKTEMISRGDFEARVSPGAGGGEIKQLAESFNEMVDALKRITVSRDYVDNILRSIVDMLVVLNPDLTIRQVNSSLLETLGYKETEIVGRYFSAIQLDDDSEESIPEMLLDGKIINDMETLFLARDGTRVPVIFSASPLYDSNGGVQGAACVALDITERKEAADRMAASLMEKEMLLREVHHRVKNNMQVIVSLLKLQSGKIEDTKYLEMLKESQNRIKSMALVHEKLYRSKTIARINFEDYINSIAKNLLRSYSHLAGRVNIRVESEDILVGIDTAIPCGLLINELISNSLKHAFPQGSEGEIRVKMHRSGEDEFELVVNDNGVGMQEDFDFRHTESLGLQLVSTLAEDQLNGEILLNAAGGTEFRIKFSEIKYRKRD